MKCLYYSFIYPYMIYCNQVWGFARKTNIEPLLISQNMVIRIILGVHPRYPSEPLFITLTFLSCENIFKYLIGRLMYRIYHGELSVLYCVFTKIAIHLCTIPIRSAIIICHCVELTWGNVVWDMLALLYGTAFLVLISIQTSVSLFSLEVLKQQYVITYFNLLHPLHHLHPCWNVLAICETDKGPINPSGFPAPFAPMIIYCCICTGIYILCW